MNPVIEQFTFGVLRSIASFISVVSFPSSRMRVMCASAGCTLLFAAAQAQALSQSQPDRAEADADTLQEIIITARKREESVQSIPETVVAISSEVLEKAHFTKMDDLGS